MKSHMKCDIPYIDDVGYNKDSITNIISLKDMTNKFRATMDSKEELALLVHMPDKTVKLKQFMNGLYAMDPNDKESFEMKTQKPYQFLNTQEGNIRFMSARQQKRATLARELYESMGTPTVDDLKAMIRMNLMKNDVVTTAEVNLGMKAYGPDIWGIKGKTTRSQLTPVASNLVKIPEELLDIQHGLIISMDGLTVNSLKLPSTISHDLYYRTAQYVTSPVASVYEICMDEQLGVYKRGGFTISEIHCHNESHK